MNRISRNMPKLAYCVHCQRLIGYRTRGIAKIETIKGKKYEFIYTRAFCKKCGNELPVEELVKINRDERDRQYRRTEKLISRDAIQRLVKMYGVSTGDLSVALGFSEQTVKRYLQGQIPTKEDSDIMIKALADPGYLSGSRKEKI